MKKHARFVLLAIVVIAVAILAYRYVSRPLEADVYTVVRQEAEEYFIEEGIVKSDSLIKVFSTAQGALASVDIAEGQAVKKGDIICVIDSSEYEFSIAQAQSVIKGYEAQKKTINSQSEKPIISIDAQISSLNTVIEQNGSDLAIAHNDADAAESLYELGAISKSDYDNAIVRVSTMQRILDSSIEQLASLQQLKIAEEHDRATKEYSERATKEYYDTMIQAQNVNIALFNKKIEDCTIKAPADGLITTLYVKDSNIVNAASPVAVITTEHSNEIEVYIPAKSFNSVHSGDEVTLTQAQTSGDIIFSGKVIAVENEAVAKSSTLGIEEKKVKVTVLPTPKEDTVLFAGFAVDVRFITFRAENQITVPKTAVFKNSNTDKDMVWVVIDGIAELREVSLGRELRTEYIVTASLSEGDIIIKNADTDGIKKDVRVKYIY